MQNIWVCSTVGREQVLQCASRSEAPEPGQVATIHPDEYVAVEHFDEAEFRLCINDSIFLGFGVKFAGAIRICIERYDRNLLRIVREGMEQSK
jgi:hypothetical protein